MSDNRKKEFVQEYLYAEDYSLFYESYKKKKEKDEPSGVVEIDLNYEATTIIEI